MINLFLMSLAVASISETITRSTLFTKPRKLIKSIPFFGKLFYCPYCLAHWVSFGFILINFNGILDFILYSFALITLSIPWMFLIELFFNQLEKH